MTIRYDKPPWIRWQIFDSAVRYEFPLNTYNELSKLTNIVTESSNADCKDSFAYIADPYGFGLVVYNMAQNIAWRVESNFFYPYPNLGELNVDGVSMDVMQGVFGLALGN